MIARFSITHKIVLVLVVLQVIVITLVVMQYSQTTLMQYHKNEQEKAELLMQTLQPVVNLQMSLGFEQAMAKQLDSMIPRSGNVLELTISDMQQRPVYRYAHNGASNAEHIELVMAVQDPYSQNEIGSMRLYYSTVNIEEIRQHDLRFRYKLIAIILAGALILILIVHKILSPLNALSRAIRHFDPDNGECELTATDATDEVGQIQNSVVDMISRIREYSLRLQRVNDVLERRVRERTEALEESNRKLHDLSQTDTLTRLPNRRKFDTYLESVWGIYLREQKPIALIIADIDHFKQVNDSFGHAAGDRVLVEFAQCLREFGRRKSDLVARYGGEEFVILLPGSSEDEAHRFALMVQERIQKRSFDDIGMSITASFGVASIVPSDMTSQQEFFEHADRALYRAKRLGRDRIVLGSDTVDASQT